MFQAIHRFAESLIQKFDQIPAERKLILQQITAFVQQQKDDQKPIQLVYICTHNSRRSHFGQIAASTAASFYGIENLSSFSGGTETTAFNPNAIEAITHIGYEVVSEGSKNNPIYTIRFGDSLSTTCFSKLYSDDSNPKNNFAAIMTCDDADQNCPYISGASMRFSTSYQDPKQSDGTAQQSAIYMARFEQILTETMYAFSLLR
jgi:protein-tyrosine phosphatase/arsenate reductase